MSDQSQLEESCLNSSTHCQVGAYIYLKAKFISVGKHWYSRQSEEQQLVKTLQV